MQNWQTMYRRTRNHLKAKHKTLVSNVTIVDLARDPPERAMANVIRDPTFSYNHLFWVTFLRHVLWIPF